MRVTLVKKDKFQEEVRARPVGCHASSSCSLVSHNELIDEPVISMIPY